MTAADLRATFRPKSRYVPARRACVCVENTHNGAGGVVTPLDELKAIRAAAAEQGLPVAHGRGATLERERRYRCSVCSRRLPPKQTR